MHGHRGFSGTGHSLNDDVRLRRGPDDRILFLLDRGDDLSQHRLFALGQILGEKLVVGHHIRIKEILQLVVFDLIGPFSFQVHLVSPVIFHLILTESRTVLVINGCHRSPPVNDNRL